MLYVRVLTRSRKHAQYSNSYIRQFMSNKDGDGVRETFSFRYGGSCNATNAKVLCENVDIEGGLIGGASLKSADFKAIIDAF